MKGVSAGSANSQDACKVQRVAALEHATYHVWEHQQNQNQALSPAGNQQPK